MQKTNATNYRLDSSKNSFDNPIKRPLSLLHNFSPLPWNTWVPTKASAVQGLPLRQNGQRRHQSDDAHQGSDLQVEVGLCVFRLWKQMIATILLFSLGGDNRISMDLLGSRWWYCIHVHGLSFGRQPFFGSGTVFVPGLDELTFSSVARTNATYSSAWRMQLQRATRMNFPTLHGGWSCLCFPKDFDWHMPLKLAEINKKHHFF